MDTRHALPEVYRVGDELTKYNPQLVLHALIHMYKDFKRIAVIGGGGTGKSTSVREFLRQFTPETRPYVIHGDKYIGQFKWEDQSLRIKEEAEQVDGPLIAEGLKVVSALRKGMKVDAVLYLTRVANTETHKNGAVNGAQTETIFREWKAGNPKVPVIEL